MIIIAVGVSPYAKKCDRAGGDTCYDSLLETYPHTLRKLGTRVGLRRDMAF